MSKQIISCSSKDLQTVTPKWDHQKGVAAPLVFFARISMWMESFAIQLVVEMSEQIL